MNETSDIFRTPIEPWFSVEEISNHLGVSKETVYRWLERKRIPAHRIGRLWKFKPSEVDEWIRKGEAIQDDGSSISAPKIGSVKAKKKQKSPSRQPSQGVS